jgi:hypothetical protein
VLFLGDRNEVAQMAQIHGFPGSGSAARGRTGVVTRFLKGIENRNQ